jgi:hypothetical protein
VNSVLLEYLGSGAAWLFVGSGPSIEMRYPTWPYLATKAHALVVNEDTTLERCSSALEAERQPLVIHPIVESRTNSCRASSDGVMPATRLTG